MSERQFDVYPDDVKSLSAAIADQLAGMIHAGALKPGAHLVQTGLAERCSVSRVAVRDALAQLRRGGTGPGVAGDRLGRASCGRGRLGQMGM
jgi:DNA-binding GntR family transcriptional regulator